VLFALLFAVTAGLESLSVPAAAGLPSPFAIFGDPSFAPLSTFVDSLMLPLVAEATAAAAANTALASAAAVSSSSRAERASALLYVGQPEHALVPPVPSHLPSPGQVPPVVIRWDFVVTPGDDLDGTLDGDDLPFVVVVAAWAVIELLRELGANGEGPTAETVVTVDDAVWLDEFTVGGGVRPREDGRGICLVF